jgi:hypothetical protein
MITKSLCLSLLWCNILFIRPYNPVLFSPIKAYKDFVTLPTSVSASSAIEQPFSINSYSLRLQLPISLAVGFCVRCTLLEEKSISFTWLSSTTFSYFAANSANQLWLLLYRPY